MSKGNRIKINDLLKILRGIHTIESIASLMHIDRKKAVYYVYRLRKAGFIKTKKQSNNKRVYSISFENKLGGTSYIDILNKNSPVKLASSQDYTIYGKSPSLEETLVFAIKTRDFRTILASLALFKKIHNWKELYQITKQNNLEREIGALYDLSRTIIKTRKMRKRFRKNILPKKNEKYTYIIKNLKSNDFKEIENLWKVYIPFNKQDLSVYTKLNKK